MVTIKRSLSPFAIPRPTPSESEQQRNRFRRSPSLITNRKVILLPSTGLRLSRTAPSSASCSQRLTCKTSSIPNFQKTRGVLPTQLRGGSDDDRKLAPYEEAGRTRKTDERIRSTGRQLVLPRRLPRSWQIHRRCARLASGCANILLLNRVQKRVNFCPTSASCR